MAHHFAENPPSAKRGANRTRLRACADVLREPQAQHAPSTYYVAVVYAVYGRFCRWGIRITEYCSTHHAVRGYVALTVKLKPIISATYLRIRRASSRRRHSKRRVGRWPRRRPSQGTVVTRMNYTYVRACLGARSSWSSRCGQIEGGRRIGRVPCPSQNYDEINEQPLSLSLC